MTLYVRDSDLAERYSVSRTTIWRWAQQGRIPTPIQLSNCCTRWKLDEIEAYDADREKEQA